MDGYFFPGASPTIRDTFILQNHAAAYAYEPSGFSPETRETHFFEKKIAPDEYICGPILRRRKGAQASNLEIKHTQEEQEMSFGGINAASQVAMSENGFAARKQLDGTLLIKSGPRLYRSRFGSGQCGACPRAGLEIYSLRPDGKTTKLIELEQVVGNEDDFDIRLLPNWSRIDVYSLSSSTQRRWNHYQYCFSPDAFNVCGTGQHDPAPSPRNLHFPRFQ